MDLLAIIVIIIILIVVGAIWMSRKNSGGNDVKPNISGYEEPLPKRMPYDNVEDIKKTIPAVQSHDEIINEAMREPMENGLNNIVVTGKWKMEDPRGPPPGSEDWDPTYRPLITDLDGIADRRDLVRAQNTGYYAETNKEIARLKKQLKEQQGGR